jgi:hypothetical protein
MSMKNYNDIIASFRLVAQCLNQLRHRVPQISTRKSTVHFVRDIRSYHSIVDADSSSGILRRIDW